MQREYEEKPWEYFDITKQDRGKNKPALSQIQLKQKIIFTSRDTSFMSNLKCLQVTSINSRGGGRI
jgi:hypothetical protein